GQLFVDVIDLSACAEFLPHIGLAILALWRQGRVQLEGTPAHFRLHIRHHGKSRLEALAPQKAPWADDVRDHIDSYLSGGHGSISVQEPEARPPVEYSSYIGWM